jgi:molybdopterin-containing oxidoreductase family iron-sulfur binding subunit
VNHPNPTHWRGVEEWESPVLVQQRGSAEFEDSPLRQIATPGRRDFLKAAGFLFAAGSFTACSRAPEEKALPPVTQIENVVPGRSYQYATVCGGCPSGCGVLAKVRDGRPLKFEGNAKHPLNRGGLCAAGQASILGLYDSHRRGLPRAAGKEISWEEADRGILERLAAIRRDRGAVRVLSATVNSPTLQRQIDRFLSTFDDAKHVVVDPLSVSAIPDAHERTHGVRRLPRFHFAKAEVVASFDADFLGSWISPAEFTRGYTEARLTEGLPNESAWHTQVESRYSLSGGKADERWKLAPWEVPAALEHLVAELAERAGDPFRARSNALAAERMSAVRILGERLWNARGRGLVLYGGNDLAGQMLCNLANELLGNYGKTLDLSIPSLQRQGCDRDYSQLVAELTEGRVAALLVHSANPVADLPFSEPALSGLKKLPLLVSLASREDETAAIAGFHCPDADPAECWGDAEPVSGCVSVRQPLVQPLSKARAAVESFAAWDGRPASSFDLVRDCWRETIHSRAASPAGFDEFWHQALHDGVAEVKPALPPPGLFVRAAVQPPSAVQNEAFALQLYAKPGMIDGALAYNPWLHEMPDPVTKAVWDNYVCLSPAKAKEIAVHDGDVVRIAAGDSAIELPVLVQVGQHDSVIAVALGYGRSVSGRFQNIGPQWFEGRSTTGSNGLVGVNAAPLLAMDGEHISFTRRGVTISKTGRRHALAVTQLHHTLTVPPHLDPGGPPRPIVQEASLDASKAEASEHREEHPELWPRDHAYNGHRWAMAIDLDACTGCSACMVSCQIENNVPVVGKDEVARNREMHWIRIDRYYSGTPENPRAAHQPMMCQHCEHAPCETVCPVLATVHSGEGLNQQVYNRCVGTRYCANNCPYKVRRFNWFDYPRNDKLANLLLNPDVTVRSRGVMEKCSFCVQRIQEAKLEAKRQGRELQDLEIATACQQSCPAGAIVFGDLNNPESTVSKRTKNPRRYRVLEEINVRPSVNYLKVVRRDAKQPAEEQHG